MPPQNTDTRKYEDLEDPSITFGKKLANAPPGEEVVISGISGKYPESNNVQEFASNLLKKVDMVTEDTRRWEPLHPEIPRRAGKIPSIEKFDAGYFGISHKQSTSTDPMYRIILEKCIEAIMDAGLNPAELENTNTGVFVGLCFIESEQHWYFKNNAIQMNPIIGCERTMAPHRISFFLKLKGPSFVIDSACSSSLYAFEHAYKSLRMGKCDRALVAAANLCTHPFVSLQFARLGVLSEDGSCKAFDKDGNGYARSETVGCILLEKAKVAKRSYYTVVHAKTNCDGFKSSGITFPSREMQASLLKEFYQECNVKPSELSFLEAHGTGTKVGDPEELQAIEEAFLGNRSSPLLIGSSKSNVGHCEPSSAMCSLTKVVIATETEFIPPNLHYKAPRPDSKALVEGRLKVVSEKMPFQDDRGLVGINSFGFGGSNCHVLLKRNPKVKVNNGRPKDDMTRIVCVSGRTRTAVALLLDDVVEKINAEQIRLIQDVFRQKVEDFNYRGYSLVNKCGEVTRSIKYLNYPSPFYVCFSELESVEILGKQLLQIPIFEKTIQKISEILTPTKINIFNLVTTHNGSPINHYLASAVIQIGLINVIKMLDIEPTGYFAVYSVPLIGELICNFYDGNVSLRDTVELAYLVINKKEKEVLEHIAKISPECGKPSPKYLNNASPITVEYAKKTFKNGLSSKVSYSDRISKASVVIQVGNNQRSKELLGKYNVVNISSSYEHFLNGIGSLYEAGHYPQVQRLYPEINFPVSRGTPMIAPHIKWNHERDWWVTRYTVREYLDVEAIVANVNTDHPTYKYLAGHVIDGRNLFPATGYLLMAWETLCKIFTLRTEDTDVIFENCKFKRACRLFPTTLTELVTLVQRSTGNFEIEEDGVPVMSGRIYLAKSSKGEMCSLQRDISIPKEGPGFTKKDIYKELKLRGYHYGGEFKGLEAADLNCEVGYIKWKKNYVTFMDNMLQMKILQEDTRLLYVPTTIKRVYINTKLHEEIAKTCGENPMPVYVSRSTGVVRSGGIEIRGLIANSIPRRKYLGTPVLEKYEFVPNVINGFDTQTSIRVMIQMALENAANLKVKAVEVIDEATREGSEPLSPAILEVLGDLPLIKSDITIFAKTEMKVDGNINVENRKLFSETDCTLIIASSVLQSVTSLQICFAPLIPGGYVLSREALDVYISASVSEDDVTILAVHTTETEKLVLFRKAIQTLPKKVIEVSQTHESFKWLEPLKATIKEDPNVIVYSQNETLSGVLGLVNCIRREPGGLNVQCFFILDNAPLFDIFDPFYVKQVNKNMAINVYKNGKWGTYRHLLMDELQQVEAEHFFVNTLGRGDLSSLKWIEGNLRSTYVSAMEKTLVYIYYSSLNFRDVMTASGKINADVVTRDRRKQECVQGFEFAGKTKDGRRVMGMISNGGLATMVEAEESLLWDIPDDWTIEDAATVVLVYGTSLHSLLTIGNIKRGDSILIHSGSGGIGISAITIALHLGCKVYTTVGTPEKREFLKQRFPELTDSDIANSRDTSFENHIMIQTKGRGVDFVLNSLADEKLIASVRCLAYGGKFLEIGKYDIGNDNRLKLDLFKRGASFHGVMLDTLFNAIPQDRVEFAESLRKIIASGSVKPLPRTVFKQDEIEKAFRHMMTGKHIGKVLIQVREEEQNIKALPKPRIYKGVPRYYCNPEEVVIICGGLGGFGLELADWLVLRGCQNLVLNSRNGIKTGYQAHRVGIWKSYGCDVHLSTDDITTKEGVEKLITESADFGKIRSIFNLAVILKDALLENQTAENYKISFGPKADATRYLDEISREMCPDLRDFVVFSSVSCGRGNTGQTNYGMANSVMERICEKRKKDGYPALAIQWGAVGEVGLVAEMQENYIEMEIGGTLQQRLSSCLQVLDGFLRQDKATIVSSMVVAEKRSGSGGADNVLNAVANILGIKDLKAISFQATLAEVGMDSMSAVEIKQTLEREFEVFLTPQDIKTMTFDRLQEIQTDLDEQKEKGIKKERALVGVEMVMRRFGDETVENTPVLELKSKPSETPKSEKPTIIMMPGIEGAACILDPLAINLDANLVGIQYCDNSRRHTIEEIAEVLLSYVEDNLTKTKAFKMIGYSFGTVVGVELVRLLESKGYTGTLVCIDGAPLYMQRLAKMVTAGDEDQFQTNILIQIMALELPQEVVSKSVIDLLKCSNFEDRIALAKKIGEVNNAKLPRTEEQIKNLILNMYSRLKAVDCYKPNYKLKSNVKLFKAKYVSIKLDSDSYELSELCENPVEVTEFEGNHATILQNPTLADEIMTAFCGKSTNEEEEASKDVEDIKEEEEKSLS